MLYVGDASYKQHTRPTDRLTDRPKNVLRRCSQVLPERLPFHVRRQDRTSEGGQLYAIPSLRLRRVLLRAVRVRTREGAGGGEQWVAYALGGHCLALGHRRAGRYPSSGCAQHARLSNGPPPSPPPPSQRLPPLLCKSILVLKPHLAACTSSATLTVQRGGGGSCYGCTFVGVCVCVCFCVYVFCCC